MRRHEAPAGHLCLGWGRRNPGSGRARCALDRRDTPEPGDEAVLGISFDEGRVLITLDKNFGELAIVCGKPHCGIIRLVDLPARQQGTYCAVVLDRFADELSRGAILTVTSERVRIRPAD